MNAANPPSSREFAPPNDPSSPFVHAHLLDGRGGGHRIDDDQVAAWRPEQGMLWVHLEVGNAIGRKWIIGQSGMDPLIAEAMAAGETRPRSLALPSGLLVILRGVNMNPGSEPEDMVSIRIWIERDRIITVRRRFLLSIQDLRQDIAQNLGPKTTGEFLVSLTERLAQRIGNVVEDIDTQVDDIEANLTEGRMDALQHRIGAMRREAAAIRRYLAPQREALNRIRGKTDLLDAREMHDLEEQSDLMMRFIEDLDLAREQAFLLHEQLASRLANEQNARLYVLSIVAALFLPLSFLTGLLGMNVAGLPGLEYPPAFAISVAIMVGVAVALLAYFRFKRWI
jgi:zinc transporter